MIRNLVATELRSEVRLFSTFTIAALGIWALLYSLSISSETANPSILTALVGLAAFVIGSTAVTIRKRRQRRLRLFAQLPVTPLAVHTAQWIVIAIGLAVPLILWLGFFGSAAFKFASSDIVRMAQVITLVVSLIVIKVALISIGNTATTLRRPLKLWVRVGHTLVIVALILLAMMLMSGWGLFRQPGGTIDWTILLATAIGTAVLLVTADFLIDREAGERLG